MLYWKVHQIRIALNVLQMGTQPMHNFKLDEEPLQW